MSVYSNLHFCLIGAAKAEIESRAHDELADVIEVTMRIGDARVCLSGNTAEVRGVLSEMLAAALRVTPKPAQPEAQP